MKPTSTKYVVLHADIDLCLAAEFFDRLLPAPVPARNARPAAASGKQFCGFIQKRVNIIADCRHDREEFIALLLDKLAEILYLLVGRQVAFVAGDQHGTQFARSGLNLQFFVDDAEVLLRVSALAAGNIDNVNEHAATLYMAQKLMTEAHTLPCALDKAGNIRHDKRWRVRHMHHAEHRGDGRKVVVCNVRFASLTTETSVDLPTFGKPTKAHIGEQFEFKLKLRYFTRCAGLCKRESGA